MTRAPTAATDAPPRVRPAGASDLDAAAPLFDAYRVFYGAASDIAAARRFLTARIERDESVVLLAYLGATERAVGFAQLYRSFSSVALREIVILNDLFVSPEARGRGVGARLMDAAVAHARATGALRVELATRHDNHSAQRLYAAKRFVPDREFVYYAREV